MLKFTQRLLLIKIITLSCAVMFVFILYMFYIYNETLFTHTLEVYYLSTSSLNIAYASYVIISFAFPEIKDYL